MFVALRARMPLVIECKGCHLPDIVSIHGAVWTMGDLLVKVLPSDWSSARAATASALVAR